MGLTDAAPPTAWEIPTPRPAAAAPPTITAAVTVPAVQNAAAATPLKVNVPLRPTTATAPVDVSKTKAFLDFSEYLAFPLTN